MMKTVRILFTALILILLLTHQGFYQESQKEQSFLLKKERQQRKRDLPKKKEQSKNLSEHRNSQSNLGRKSALLVSDIFSEDDIKLIKELENSIKMGYSGGLWYPYESLEGGSMTIGYGHKIKGNEDISTLTDESADALLRSDLQISLEKVSALWDVSDNHLKILTILDFSTKGIVSPIRWPMLAKAIEVDCKESIKKEIVTHYVTPDGKKIPLLTRASKISSII